MVIKNWTTQDNLKRKIKSSIKILKPAEAIFFETNKFYLCQEFLFISITAQRAAERKRRCPSG